MKASIYTLGCKTNQFESQALEKLLAAKGFEIVPFGEDADVYIINSCTVTATADKKTAQMIRRVRREHKGALVAVCGCMAQLNPERLKSELGVDIVGGNRDHAAFSDEIERTLLKNAPCRKESAQHGFSELPAGSLLGRTRALLKIEDGCDNFCSYCIVPYARGRVRSLPFEKAVDEARRLCMQGYREIVITGIEISSYGKDLGGGETLLGLTEVICAAAKGARISLGSLNPTAITEEFCARLSKCDNLCRHIHLSLQSGDDEILRRMNRHYTSDDVRRAVALLRKYFDNINITSDLICGFCGETEQEFEHTKKLVEECAFTKVHVFPYSARPGTAAFKLKDDVEKSVKERRCAEISEISKKMLGLFLQRQVGREHIVLFEQQTKKHKIGGYTSNYLYAEAEASGEISRGDMKRVKILGADGGRLECAVCAAK